MSVPAVTDPLSAAVAEVESHVSAGGWDQPPRLFALASTADLIAAQPQIAAALGEAPPRPGALTPIEQDALAPGDLGEVLAGIAWPPQVLGCALVQEVVILPPGAEEAAPDTDDAALSQWAAGHPQRREVRLATAVLRSGERACCLRIRGEEDDVLTGGDLAPRLAEALLATLAD